MVIYIQYELHESPLIGYLVMVENEKKSIEIYAIKERVTPL